MHGKMHESERKCQVWNCRTVARKLGTDLFAPVFGKTGAGANEESTSGRDGFGRKAHDFAGVSK